MDKLSKELCLLSILIFLLTSTASSVLADPIRVGVLLPLTGKLAKFGEIEKKSFFMAVDEINEAGGANGRKIDLIIEDTTGKADVGHSAIEKVISRDKVCIVGGGCSSSVTWAAAAVAQHHKVPFLVNTASADKITEQGWKYVFRLNPPVSEYPKALVSFLIEIAHVKTVAILYENSLFGKSESKKLSKQCKKLSLPVVMMEGYEAGAINFKPLLVNVKIKKPDLVCMVSHVIEASLLMRQAKELGLNAKLFLGSGAGFTSPQFQKNAGDASEYVFSAARWTPCVPYPGAKSYYAKFLARYNSLTEYHGAQAYAAMYVIADALKRSESLTPKDVRDALAETDMMTAFGPVRFVSYGRKARQNKIPTFLAQWINGSLETVWPTEVATVKHVYPVPKWNER